MEWPKAYHFHLDDEIDINKAIELRIRKDPRAGDLYCHKSCFEGKIGSRLMTIKKGINRKAHFRRWPGEYTKANTNCRYENISDSKRESMDYSQFYLRFQNFINEMSKNIEPYFIEEIDFEEVGEFAPDFTINHTKNNPYDLSQTKIHIIDENKRRRKKIGITRVEDNVATIVLRISEYTPEQLKDFKRGGIDKFKLEWDYLLISIKDRIVEERIAEEERIKVEERIEVEGKIPQRRELSKRDNELLQLIKQHMAICGPFGMTAFNYGLLDGPKGGGDNAPLGIENTSLEEDFLRRIKTDLIDQGLAEWVCSKCMNHHKTYIDCPNTQCDDFETREDNIRRWKRREERDNPDRDKYELEMEYEEKLKQLEEEEIRNPTITEFCSLCSVLLQEHSSGGEPILRTENIFGLWKIDSINKFECEVKQLRSTLPESISIKINYSAYSDKDVKGLEIIHKKPLTEGQVKEISANVDISGLTRYDALGLDRNRYSREMIAPGEFYTKMSPEIHCPKCNSGLRYGEVGDEGSEMFYNSSCDCDQGKVASVCDTCNGGTIRPDMRYLHLKLNCDCSLEPECTDHRWTLRLLVATTNDEPKQLSVICACCGYKVFGDDYFVGDKIRDFWICRSANRMLTNSEYDEFLYARHGCELADWWRGDPWHGYING